MSDDGAETIKVEITNVPKLQQELAEIREQIKRAHHEEISAKNKMENLEKFRNRRDSNTFRGQRMPARGLPPRDGRRDNNRRGRFRDRRDSRRDNRRGDRDRSRRDRFGRREDDRQDVDNDENKNFYGLARSTGAMKRNRNKSEENNPLRSAFNQNYSSKYADAKSSSEEEEELPPTQMISLVTVDSDKEDGEKSGGSDSDSDSESVSEAHVKEEPTLNRGRKRGREGKGDVDRKRRRVNILASMKKDKNNQTRSKRLFGFMMQHLGRARKESKEKPDLQATITKKAQELKSQQKRVIDKAFQEKQKEKYEARLEYQRKTLGLHKWKKKHIENLLRADGMKAELKVRVELIESGMFLTKNSPPITWQPATELDQEFMVSLKEKCKEGLRLKLDRQIQEMMDNEGEEPEVPDKLPRKYQVSPIRGRREDDVNPKDNRDNRKRFGFGGMTRDFGGMKRDFGGMKREFGGMKREFGGLKREFGGLKREFSGPKREEAPSRRDRERERPFRNANNEGRRNNRMSSKDIKTRNFRHRQQPTKDTKNDQRDELKSRIKEEPTPQPSMMSLVSVAED